MPKFQVGDVVRIVANNSSVRLRGQTIEHPIGAIRIVGHVYAYPSSKMDTTYSVNAWDGDRKVSNDYNFTVNDSMLELATSTNPLKDFM
jgi:hypothetical protein